MKKTLIITSFVILLLVIIFAVYRFSLAHKQVINRVQLANPASENCNKVGGNLVMEKRGDGGEYGLCYFDDNRACEEWALLRGDCPLGGVKTTGFDAIDQKYCAWLGGSTLAVSQSVCTFKDGSSCPTEEFYNGKCFVK